jgi:type IV pilus assembly protein PilM
VAQLPIGVDIGSTAVRLLQLGGSERDLRVVDAGKIAISREAAGRTDTYREAVVSGIRRLLKERRFRGHEAVMALAPEQASVRNIRMPAMDAAELDGAVHWEAQNKFPFDTATAVIQYQRAGQVYQGDEALEEIIVFATPREEIEATIALASEAGLNLVSLDAEPCTVFRGFERFLQRREDEDTACLMADVGARTQVVISRGRDIVFVKMIPIGGAVFNRAVAECLDLEPSEAEALRRRIGARTAEGEIDDHDRAARAVADAIRPHLEDLADEIGLCLRYYGVTFRGPTPDAIQLTGGEAHNPTIPAALADRLGMPAEVADPFRRVRTDHLDPVVDRRGLRAEWATAFGLSLKGFHLDRMMSGQYAA